NGVLFGGTGRFLAIQIGATMIGIVYAFLATSVILWVINKVTPVKVAGHLEEKGLDEALHGEVAYDG
ncbi:ammonium transporter, partial [bacterium]|nr:ammonium transporter [bacterium]